MKTLLQNHEREIERLIASRVAEAKDVWLAESRKLEQAISDAAGREAALIKEIGELKQRLKEARSYKDYYSKLLDQAKEIELELHRKCADYHVKQQELEEALAKLQPNSQVVNNDDTRAAKVDLVRLDNQIHAARAELARLQKEIELTATALI
ncbi:hypothetical protein [Methylomonas methanica]|uniref:Uncharacterized protein n=1 Tax=Methylomonas methanica (strain DSM 25384 / MC09) TaxID=857087 RepID=F9ZX97_METMM|nr:hypothetical protein [Methylomonas methanica]AEF99707.1 hypothetical protein Metme_1281 [Methylomonas methanica MC09]